MQNTGRRCRELRQSCSSCGGEKELLQFYLSKVDEETSVESSQDPSRTCSCCSDSSVLLYIVLVGKVCGQELVGAVAMVVQCWAYEVQWCSSSVSVIYSYLELLAIMSCLQLEVCGLLSVFLCCGEMMLLCSTHDKVCESTHPKCLASAWVMALLPCFTIASCFAASGSLLSLWYARGTLKADWDADGSKRWV